MDGCTVTFTGEQGGTYYVSCNVVRYLDSETLVNNYSSTIYLYPAYNQGQTQTTLTISSLSYPRYTYNNSYRYITNASNISFNAMSHFYREYDYVSSFFLAVIAIGVTLKVLMRGGKR